MNQYYEYDEQFNRWWKSEPHRCTLIASRKWHAYQGWKARQEGNIEAQHSGGVAGGQGTANTQSTSASQIADSMQAACIFGNDFVPPRESWVREWIRQLRTL